MTIKDLLEKIQDLEFTEEQVKHIKKCLGIKDIKWRPKKKEKYFYLDDRGSFSYSTFDDVIDNDRLNINNCFKTKEDVLFRLEQIKVYNELKNFADKNNEEINWKDEYTTAYYIYYNYKEDTVGVSCMCFVKYIGQIYFSSREVAQQALEKVGANRIKKYLFGVE